MKICFSALGDNLNAEIDPRFGRCRYFIIVDTDTGEYESFENDQIAAAGGAGIQSGQFIAGKGVKAVLTGNIGPNAFRTLQAAEIEVITGVKGTIKEVLELYKKGELTSAQGPSVNAKFGI